jgi:hypothetical protein
MEVCNTRQARGNILLMKLLIAETLQQTRKSQKVMLIRAELVQGRLFKSNSRLDLGKSNIPLLPPPTYWLF